MAAVALLVAAMVMALSAMEMTTSTASTASTPRIRISRGYTVIHHLNLRTTPHEICWRDRMDGGM